jgi:hypothetical protein
MKRSTQKLTFVAAAATATLLSACAGGMMSGSSSTAATASSGTGMSFFVTSKGSGRGADLGGLAGADRLCTSLAADAGAGRRTWRAYLSAQGAGGTAAINARDRIGSGPWRNAKGVVVAQNVADLHGPNNNINKQTALTERGDQVKGRGDTPNMHDILTGSQPDGTAIAGAVDSTCGNWTKSGEGAAMVGHHDRMGLDTTPPALSWNSSHQSRGCSQANLVSTGGDGRIYCFAAD